MVPARMALWAMGAAMGAITLSFMFDTLGRGEQPNPIVEAANSAPAQELVATDAIKNPESNKIDNLAEPRQESVHAIVPDAPQAAKF